MVSAIRFLAVKSRRDQRGRARFDSRWAFYSLVAALAVIRCLIIAMRR